MKIYDKIWVVLVISAIIVGPTSELEASPPGIPRSIHSKFGPVEIPKGPGPITLELAFMKMTWKNEFEREVCDCNEVQVRIEKLYKLEYLGDRAWTVQVDSGVWYRTAMNFVIPPNDTSGVEITVQCNRIPSTHYCYFVTTGDTLEYHQSNPKWSHPPEPPVKNYEPIIDTMTQAQLQTKYEMIVQLRDSASRNYVEMLVGKIGDSALFNSNRKLYRLWITLQNLIKMGKNGIEFDFVTPPPWDKTSPNPQSIDSAQPRGSLPNPESQKSTGLIGGISLDHVDGNSTNNYSGWPTFQVGSRQREIATSLRSSQ